MHPKLLLEYFILRSYFEVGVLRRDSLFLCKKVYAVVYEVEYLAYVIVDR